MLWLGSEYMNTPTHMRVPFCCTGNVGLYNNSALLECIHVLDGIYASEEE
jgi:hypothetical protein